MSGRLLTPPLRNTGGRPQVVGRLAVSCALGVVTLSLVGLVLIGRMEPASDVSSRRPCDRSPDDGGYNASSRSESSDTSKSSIRGAMHKLVVKHAGEVVSGLVVGLLVSLVAFLLTYRLEHNLTDEQRSVEDLRALRQERLENLRFVRERADPGSRKPFASLDLRGMPLAGLDLSCEGSEDLDRDPQCADFTGAVLADADMTLTHAPQGQFEEADLTRANLNAMSATVANFALADLAQAVLTAADFTGSNFVGANMDDVKAEEVHFDHVRLDGASLRRADLAGAYMRGAELNNVDLDGAQLQGAQLAQADSMFQTQLSSANLRGADLRRADAQGVVFIRANLTGADLRGANLRGAVLYGAQVQSAEWSGADLRGSDLRGTTIRQSEVSGACFDDSTRWPAGVQLPSPKCPSTWKPLPAR